jgi:CheY-like chemotaxis protein
VIGGPALSVQEPLAGRRVLIVEDEAMIALLIQDVLTELGSTVVGPASRIEEAIELARSSPLDLAALDLNLAGSPVYPVAEILTDRGVPFVFMTGYGQHGIAEPWRSRPSIAKPFRPSQLATFLRDALRAAPA